jgi:hypothetical protein
MSNKNANKWKYNQFKILLDTCEIMESNNISKKLIKSYKDQQYDEIINKYNLKVEKNKQKNKNYKLYEEYNINDIIKKYPINDNINFID